MRALGLLLLCALALGGCADVGILLQCGIFPMGWSDCRRDSRSTTPYRPPGPLRVPSAAIGVA